MSEKQFAPVGVMDSGVGGISVLRELVKLLPGENFLYYGDSAHAPYGTKEVAEVVKYTKIAAEFLLEKGSKALVVACNTATSVAIPVLRETYGTIPVIGIEPALKPAVLSGDHPRILVMATPMTLEQEKFSNMMHFYEKDANIVKVPCPGLVELIEGGILEGAELEGYLTERFAPFEPNTADGIVLGCTHYPLIRGTISKLFPKAEIFDGGYGTAKQTRRRLEECGLLSPEETGGKVTFFNSKADPAILALSQKLLDL